MPPLEVLLESLASAAATAPSLARYRARVLELLASVVAFDAALVHALSPRVPLSSAVVFGLDVAAVAESSRRWDELGDLLSPLRELANRRLVATDGEALGRRSGARKRLEEAVLRPFGQKSLCMVHLIIRKRVVAAIVLFGRRAQAFGPREVATLKRLAPVIAVGDALHQQLDAAPLASSPQRLSCLDQRLTDRQREVVEHVALGHTNDEIGAALDISPNSVRNHLVRIFARIGACNRADVVRLAVLVPGRAGEATRRRSKAAR